MSTEARNNLQKLEHNKKCGNLYRNQGSSASLSYEATQRKNTTNYNAYLIKGKHWFKTKRIYKAIIFVTFNKSSANCLMYRLHHLDQPLSYLRRVKVALDTKYLTTQMYIKSTEQSADHN